MSEANEYTRSRRRRFRSMLNGDEWVPPATQWKVLLVGVIVIALMIAVFVLYKKKIIKLNAPKKKTETGKTEEKVLHKEKMGTGKPKENIGFSFEGGSELK